MRIWMIALALIALAFAGRADENAAADDLFAAALERIDAAETLGVAARAEQPAGRRGRQGRWRPRASGPSASVGGLRGS